MAANISKRIQKGTAGGAAGNPIYIGIVHVGAPDDEATWTITRIWWDAAGDPAEIQTRSRLAWTERTLGWPTPGDLTLVSA